MKKLYYSVVLLILISLTGCKSNYEKGVELIKEQKYDLALENLEKVKNGDDNYEKAISSINYINGLNSYNSGKYEESVFFLSKVGYYDSFKNTADSLMVYIKNSPKYHYEKGQKEFDASKYNLAYLEFIKIPESSEEYKFCKSKILFCQAINFKNEDKLDTALIILHDINESDPIYAKVQNEIKYIERKSEFLKGKEYYENKNYDNASELLKKIDENEDYYDEAKNLIGKIDVIIKIEKTQSINSFKLTDNYCFINNAKYKITNLESYLDGTSFEYEIDCDKTYKLVFQIKDFSHKKGGSSFSLKEDKRVSYSKSVSGFEDISEITISGSYYKIDNNDIIDQIDNNPNNYKICLFLKVTSGEHSLEKSPYARYFDPNYIGAQIIKISRFVLKMYAEEFYVLNQNNEVVYSGK